MIQIKVSLQPSEWRAVSRAHRTLRPLLVQAMYRAMAVLHAQLTLNLSGPSHTRFPGNGNPFPGVLRGIMRASLSSIVQQSAETIRGITGPGPQAPYAINHELGIHTKARPFLGPTFKQKKAEVRRTFDQAIRSALGAS